MVYVPSAERKDFVCNYQYEFIAYKMTELQITGELVLVTNKNILWNIITKDNIIIINKKSVETNKIFVTK